MGGMEGVAVKVISTILVFWLCLLSGCGTVNAERKSYMQDRVYEKNRYHGDATSPARFSHYGLNLDHEVSNGKLKIEVDPYEVYEQEKELYVVKVEETYRRIGPIRYSPPRCVFGVVTVFPVLFASFDRDYADSLKKSCYKVYEWDEVKKELPAEMSGVETVNFQRRNYRDSDGVLLFHMMANGNVVSKMGLTGFNDAERSGSYSWTVNDWYDFSSIEKGEDLSVSVLNKRNNIYLAEKFDISKEDEETLVYRSKYDGAFRLRYTCRLCNANLTDNFYTDQEVMIWRTNVFNYKGRSSLEFIASCIEKRFDHLRHGDVSVEDADSPDDVYKDYQYLSDYYVMVRGARTPREPDIDDIRSCIRERGYSDLEITET